MGLYYTHYDIVFTGQSVKMTLVFCNRCTLVVILELNIFQGYYLTHLSSSVNHRPLLCIKLLQTALTNFGPWVSSSSLFGGIMNSCSVAQRNTFTKTLYYLKLICSIGLWCCDTCGLSPLPHITFLLILRLNGIY